MYCEQKGKWFYFDEEVFESIKKIVHNGVIKNYGHFMILMPLPELISKNEYELIIIDGVPIQWEEIIYHTKDRIKAVTGTMNTPDEVEIIDFYNKKYNEHELENRIFSEIPNIKKLSFMDSDFHWFGFRLYTPY